MSVSPAASSAGPKKSEPCPRCGKPLTDAAGLGWCQACGYCRSLEQTPMPEKEEAQVKKQSMGGLVELGEAVGGLPRWVWIMAGGCFVFTVFSLLPGWQLPKESFERALWTTCQIAVGLTLIFVAQLIAIVIIAPLDEKISFKDLIVPFRLWGLTCKLLPRTSLSAWLASWGLTMIVSALIFIGGLPYWMNYLPKSNNGKQGQAHSQKR